MSTRSKAAQGSNQTREGLESPGFSRGENVKDSKAQTAIDLVLKHEGGLVDNPQDPGGLTNFGWSLRENPGLTADEIRSMTKAQAFQRYHEKFWLPIHGDELPIGLAMCTLDASVMSGIGNGAVWLQGAVGATMDGDIGPLTIKAALDADRSLAIADCCDRRMDFLRKLATWPYFGKGWTARVEDTREQALQEARKQNGDKNGS